MVSVKEQYISSLPAATHWWAPNVVDGCLVCVVCSRIKDKAGRRPSDPDYNSRTLLIPNAAAWFKDKKVSSSTTTLGSGASGLPY